MNERATIATVAASTEAVYDMASAARIDNPERQLSQLAPSLDLTSTGESNGCHGGKAELNRAAEAAGNGELMQRLRTDYPQGPHDQPQSMCPAFGSLRVGLRMRRTATVLSGSACCVYRRHLARPSSAARKTEGGQAARRRKILRFDGGFLTC